MAAESGSEDPPLKLRVLEEALRERSTAFEFSQLVRALERLQPDRAPVGYFTDPAEEVARFSVNPSISFPPAEIHELEWREREGAPRVVVNFFGVTGPLGVLPHHYTLLAAERRRARDGALGAFLDLFHHRILSLFHRAWKKNRAITAHEAGIDDRLAAHLLELAGLGLGTHREARSLPADALTHYAGLLAPQQRSAAALEQLIEEYFGVPVEVEQFVGGWQRLSLRDQCALGEEEGWSGRLGQGAIAGDEVWDRQSRVRLRIGPLDKARFDDFLPTGCAHEPLRQVTRLFCQDQFEFEVRLVLAPESVPGLVLGAEEGTQPLGWGTWLRSGAYTGAADETIFRL